MGIGQAGVPYILHGRLLRSPVEWCHSRNPTKSIVNEDESKKVGYKTYAANTPVCS